MPYQVDWKMPHRVMVLQLLGHVTIQEFVDIDRDINNLLSMVRGDIGVALIVDTNQAKSVPQTFNEVKTSQTYATMSNARLKFILIASNNNRLMRLMMLLIYNLCRPSLMFFDTVEAGLAFLSTTRQMRV